MSSPSANKVHQRNRPSQNGSSQSDLSRVSFKDWIGVITASLAAFMAMFALTGSAPGVPHYGGILAVPLAQAAWVIYAYTISQAIAVPIAGSLSKAFSVRRYFSASACLFVVSAVVCTLATNLPMMLAGRVVQGFAGGGFSAVSMTIINNKLPDAKRSVGLTIHSMSIALAPSISPAVAGWITYHFSWHYIFYLMLVPGVLIIAGAFYSLEPQPMQLQSLSKFDWLGFALFVTGLELTH